MRQVGGDTSSAKEIKPWIMGWKACQKRLIDQKRAAVLTRRGNQSVRNRPTGVRHQRLLLRAEVIELPPSLMFQAVERSSYGRCALARGRLQSRTPKRIPSPLEAPSLTEGAPAAKVLTWRMSAPAAHHGKPSRDDVHQDFIPDSLCRRV